MCIRTGDTSHKEQADFHVIDAAEETIDYEYLCSSVARLGNDNMLALYALTLGKQPDSIKLVKQQNPKDVE